MNREGHSTLLAGVVGAPERCDGPLLEAHFNYPVSVCFDPKTKFIYVCDLCNSRIRKISREDGVVTTIDYGLTCPSSCCFYDGYLYVSEQNQITKLCPETAEATCFAEIDATSVCPDGKGNILVTDYGNPGIKRITPDGQITTLINTPRKIVGICVDNEGDILFTDFMIRKIKISSPPLTSVFYELLTETGSG